MYRHQQNQSKRKSQNWGSSFLRTKISREAYLLEKRSLKDLKYWEWIFIVISIIGVLISLGFNIYQLTMALINKERYLFPLLLIVNNLFAVYLTITGILQELPFQILMQLITKTIIWIFNMIYFLTPPDEEEDITETEVKAIRFYISSSMLFLTIPVGSFVLYQYWTSNVSLFKTVGTEPKYVNMCRRVFLGYSLIALDVQLAFVALLLLASFGLSTTDLFAMILLPLGFLFVLIWACVGVFAIKKESRLLTYTFYIISHLQPLYVIYLLVRSSKHSVGALLFYSMIVVAAIFFITHIALLVTVVKIQFGFDKGLKQAAEKEIARTKLLSQSLTSVNNVGTEYIGDPSKRRLPPTPQETDI